MGKREKEGDSPKYPALSALKRRKKSRDYVDYDYVQKLSPEERAFLNQFTDEYYNGNSYKFEQPMLDTKEMARKNYLARQDVMNEYQRVELGDPAGPSRGREDHLIDAMDGNRPDLGNRRTFPVPAPAEPSGTTGPEGSSPHRPVTTRPTPVRDGLKPKTSIPSERLELRMSKASHQKKRARAKAAKTRLVLTPQAPVESTTGDAFRQAAALLKAGLHAGVNCAAVVQAIANMERAANAADALLNAPTPTPAPLEAVPAAEEAANAPEAG